MMKRYLLGLSAAAALAFSAGAALAQMPPAPGPRLAAQAEAMKKLAMMDGVWRGTAWTLTPAGRREVIQTERIGPMLDGTIKVIEGRGYNPDGSTGFNAFATLSFEPSTGAYTFHSYAMSQVGDFKLTPTADGYVWEIPAGPMTFRYTAVIKDGAYREIGEQVIPGKAPMQFFEMNLKRLGDSSWPEAGAIPPK